MTVFAYGRPTSLIMHITWVMLKCISDQVYFMIFSFRFVGMLVWYGKFICRGMGNQNNS